MGIVETYSVLWKILKLKPMIYMLIILMTGKVSYFSIVQESFASELMIYLTF